MRMSPLKEAKNLNWDIFFKSFYKDNVFVLNLSNYLLYYSSFEHENALIIQEMLPEYY